MYYQIQDFYIVGCHFSADLYRLPQPIKNTL